MPSKLPTKASTQGADGAARRESRQTLNREGGFIHRELRIEGRLSGLWSAIAALVFLPLLGVIFVLGLVTITIVLWLACGAILLALVIAFVRAIAGTSKRPPPPDLRL